MVFLATMAEEAVEEQGRHRMEQRHSNQVLVASQGFLEVLITEEMADIAEPPAQQLLELFVVVAVEPRVLEDLGVRVVVVNVVSSTR
jgi:hypothetical protein